MVRYRDASTRQDGAWEDTWRHTHMEDRMNFLTKLGALATVTGNDTTTTVVIHDKSMTFNISLDMFVFGYGAWRNNGIYNLKIQDAFPMLTADEREFLMTGMTPDDWKRAFPDA